MPGSIITIEGLDGAGKSTQIQLFTAKLEAMGLPYRFIHFPVMNTGVYGHLIASYLRGELGSIDQVHPKLVALLFAENRKEHLQWLQQGLNEGYLMIMDRYVNSNIAFQCAKTTDIGERQALKQWILDFEFEHNALPKPDMSFFLHVPFDIIVQSLGNNRRGDDRSYLKGGVDIHENSMQLQRKVYEEYLDMLQEQDTFHEVKCFTEHQEWLSPEQIHQQLFDMWQAGGDNI
jgi:dTMP kinase